MSSHPKNENSPVIVTASEFKSFDFEEPISNSDTVAYRQIRNLYRSAKEAAESKGEFERAKVYNILFNVCGFHFKPYDIGEPYGPLMTFDDGRRTIIPIDLKGDQADILGEIASFAKNPALRARLADIAWLCRRSNSAAKTLAIRGLNESVSLVLDGKAHFKSDGVGHISMGVDYLRRALSIARTRGTDLQAQNETKSLVIRMRDLGSDEKSPGLFRRAANLDIEYKISDFSIVASQAVEFAEHDEKRGDQEGAQQNWRIAAEAYEAGRDVQAQASC